MKAQFAWLLLSRGTAIVLQAILLILVGRAAGPADFGSLGAIIGICTLAVTIADFGISTYLSKLHALGDLGTAQAALRFNALSTILGAVLLSGVLFAAYFNWAYAWTVPFIAVSFALQKNTDTALSIPIADRLAGIPVASLMIRRVCALAAYAVCVGLGIDAIGGYAIAVLVGAVAGQVHIWIVVTRAYGRREAPRVRYRPLLRSAVPYMVGNVSAQAQTLDVAIIAAVIGDVAAGLYSAASKLTKPIMLIPRTMTTMILPYAARRGSKNARSMALKLTLGALVSTLVMIPLSLLAGPLITLAMGDAYAGAAATLAVGLIALPMVALPSPLGSLLQSQGQQVYVSINGIVFAVVTLIAIPVGAQFFGIEGVAAAIGITYAAKALSLLLRIRRLPDSLELPEQA